MLNIVNTLPDRAQAIMDKDASLLNSLGSSPILHFYQWQNPSITHGVFLDPEKFFFLTELESLSIDLGRRPTGGGITFHLWDFAFSFLMPSTHKHFHQNPIENYRFVNEIVGNVIQKVFAIHDVEMVLESFIPKSKNCENFCMARPTKYDVLYQGIKMAGSAQRKTRLGYLHQGTISLFLPDLSLIKAVLKEPDSILEAMREFSFIPFKHENTKAFREEIQNTLKRELALAFFDRCI